MSVSSAVSVTNAAGEVAAAASPQREYSTRLTERLGLLSRSTRVHVGLGNAKIATVPAIVAVVWLIYDAGFSAFLILPVTAAYVVLLVWHERTLRSLNRAAAAVAFDRRGLARIEDRWQGIGVTGDRFRDPATRIPTTSICSAPAASFNCSRSRALRWAKRGWRTG